MKKWILSCALALTGGLLAAQTRIRVETQNLVAEDEQFNVTFIVEGERPSDFQWQSGEHFQLLWGPSTGSSTSIRIVNGKTTKSSQTTYTYVVMPKEKGSFTLPAATAVVDGHSISSERISVEVVSAGAARSPSADAREDGQKENRAAPQDVDRGDLFLRMIPSRTSVVAGEPLTLTLKLYQRVNIAGFEDARFPSFNGFWSQEVEAPSSINFQRESLDDKIYNAALLRRYVLVPQQTGTLTIDPAELVCLVQVRNNRRSNDPFEMFFHDEYTTVRKRIRTSPLRIRVSPLPSGAPSSFGGGVGSFRLTASLSRDSLKTHDAASLLLTLSGNGNVSLLEAPKLSFPPDFEVYDTKVTERTDKGSGGTRGSKVFEYPFIPRSAGDFELPPVSYSYYDVQAGRYVTLTATVPVLHVAKGTRDESAPVTVSAPAVEREGVKNLGEDIRYITTRRPSLRRAGVFFFASPLFWALAVLLCLGAWLSAWVWRRRAARQADVAGMRKRRATRQARSRLKLAGKYLDQNLYTAFYEELHKALLGFFSDKLDLPAAELSKEHIGETLRSSGVDAQLTESALSLLDACEFARYAPDAGHEAMDAHYRQALDLISQMDSMIRPASSHRTLAVLLLLCTFGWNLPAAQTDSLWNAGTAAYAEGRWEEAAADWEGIRAAGWVSPELLTNIGNAWYKAGEPARAILSYERALRLDPSFQDASANLAFVNARIKDRIDTVPEWIFARWARALCYLFRTDVWAVLFLLFLAVTLSCTLLFFLSRRSGMRRTGFFCALAALVLTLSCFGMAWKQKREAGAADQAILTAPVTAVVSAPGADASKALFVLHEGTKVRLKDSVGDWYDIELADGRRGWMPAANLEII